MKDIDRLRKVTELAKESSFVKINGKTVRVGSSIYMGNRLVSSAVNSNKTNPKVVKYNNILPFEKTPFLHAEMAAIISAAKKIDIKDFRYCTLYVARKLKIDGCGLARPCPACMEAIREYGIPKVIYTTDSGYAVEFIKDIEQ